MKRFLQLTTTVLLLIAMVLSMCTTLIGCGGSTDNPSNGGNGGNGGGGGNGGNTTAGKVSYSISVKTIGGLPLADITYGIYDGDNLKAYGKTDSNGIATVDLVPSDNYTVELSTSSLDGYNVEARYSFVQRTANIVLSSSVIADSDLTGVKYELGDVMRDFTVTTTDGEKFTLSEALKTKKAVLINFWYSTCSPCINEFPFMDSAYQKYQDDIAVIAINNYAGDTADDIKIFQSTMGLTIPLAKDYSQLGSAFDIAYYPTSIIVDRYGTICLIEVGGLTSEKPFIAAFEHFSATDYQQKLITSFDELTPAELPDVEMPSSEEIGAVLNGEGFSAIYTPETESANSEYSWPFLVGEDGDERFVYTSNSYKDSSYAAMHASVELKAGQALAVDWFADTELGADILFILVDGKDIYQLSGVSEDWETVYPYVALEDGTYRVSFIYVKDEDTDVGYDRVYLKNMRTVDINQVGRETYIPRQAATKPNANGLGFQQYITPVFNPNDGYYHVGTANGPLLLANLMSSTLLSEYSLNDLGYNGELTDSQGDVYETLVTYCNYSINGTLYGYSPVTEELKALLDRAAEILGFEPGNPNQWLQFCEYYDAYATGGKQLEDPVKGVAFFAAFDTVVSTGTSIKYNTVKYDGRVIMPRGLKYKFVPATSGAYLIKSQSKDQVDGWVFDENGNILYTAEIVHRPYDGNPIDTINVSMILYFEAGKTYYIDIAYYDIYAEGEFTFTVEYLGATYQQFHLASPGYYTYIESTTGQVNSYTAGGIDVKLGADGYYHELRADGTLGSIVYADFKFATAVSTHSILKAIELGAFDFRYSETDTMVIAKLKEFGGDTDACRKYYEELWGESYAEWAAIYQLEEVLAGKYHGGGEDLTAKITAYTSKMISYSSSSPELEGCVPVDAELAKILQAFMDKYSFAGVDNSWTKLCYYYKNIAP
ncbi:MAG: TlpA family protein disulfide reductase [Clostridia bacterium]|nr:TlpA family protein disulfide reductase [Clostridia bacterium]